MSIISEKLEYIRNYLDVEVHPVVSPDRWDVYSALCDMVDDVITLLKAQEPRVMTLDEFQVSENNPKWLETKDGKHNRWTLGNAGYEKFYDNCMVGYLPIEEYGKLWRCWTSEPSDEQRKNTPWKE